MSLRRWFGQLRYWSMHQRICRTRRSIAMFEAVERRVMFSFGVAGSYSSGAFPGAATAADLNGDGRGDLVVPVGGDNAVGVFLNSADGGFQPAVEYAAGAAPVAVAAGDFNGDGKADVVTANSGANSVSILLGNGDGTLRPKIDLGLNAAPVSLVVGDFNGDGKADVAVATEDRGNDYVSLLKGNGDGTFQPPITIVSDSAPRFTPLLSPLSNIAAGDFNGDGQLDLVLANNKDEFRNPRGGMFFFTGSASVLLGNGDGTFKPAKVFAVQTSPRAVAVGDFNGDGHLDFAVANTESQTLSIFTGTGDGNFSLPVTIPVGEPVSITAADFNADGHADLAVSSIITNTVTIFSGQAAGPLQSTATYVMTGQISSTDLNGDGRADLTAVDPFSKTMRSWLNTGDGSFGAPRVVPDPGLTLTPQASADFNGDGIPDLAVTTGSGVQVELGLGDGHFGDLLPLDVNGSSLFAADSDGNGTPDLFVAVPILSGKLALLLNSAGWDNRTGGATGLTVSAPPQVTAGAPLSVTVTAVDSTGKAVPTFHGTVDLDAGATGSAQSFLAQYDFTPADHGTHTFVLNALTKAGLTQVNAYAVGLPTKDAALTVVPAAVAKLVISTPATVTAGIPFSFTVRATDAFDNTSTGYTGTIHFAATPTDLRAVVPPDFTFTAADAGVHTFSATLFIATSPTSTPLISAADAAGGVAGATFLDVVRRPGDATGDGLVNFADLLVLAQNFGNTNATWAEGDFNGDGKVDFSDLLLLAQNFS